MARTKANIKIINIANGYDALHYDWCNDELA